MCGIAGIISYKKDELRHITNMLNSIRHRGPDDEGIVFLKKDGEICFGGDDTPREAFTLNLAYSPPEPFKQDVPEGSFAVLGHRRLSIIDLSTQAHQPMSTQDKKIWIVFNGEIYNYIELREELIALGCKFHTNTDTEVVLNSYKIWGKDCLSKFNGMWSFVIYDKRNNIFFGSRDRFGVKPFYYHIADGVFAFASEIKAFFSLPFIEKKINPKAAFAYLATQIQRENEEEPFVENIYELMPSFAFEYDISAQNFKKWRYYSLPCSDNWEKFDEKKSEKFSYDIRNLVFNAVKMRLRSDVPVGSCLSGGIDSSAIVCVINDILQKETMKQIGQRQKAFTACYDLKEIDESHWAQEVIAKTGALWFKTYPKTDEFIADMRDLIYTQDIPFMSTSIYAQYMVMKLAAKNDIKVLIDGQGADEIFGGYYVYRTVFFREIIKNLDCPSFLKEFNSLNSSSFNKSTLIKSLIRSILPQKFLKAHNITNYLNNNFTADLAAKNNTYNEKKFNSLNKKLFDDVTKNMLQKLLRYEDRNSMRFSVEARTPFADDKNLIEYIFNIPPIYKMHNGFTKYLLRESMNGIIPDKIRTRTDKIGFATPESIWLKEAKDQLLDCFDKDVEEFINITAVIKDWDKLLTNKASISTTTLWRYINFAVWKKAYRL